MIRQVSAEIPSPHDDHAGNVDQEVRGQPGVGDRKIAILTDLDENVLADAAELGRVPQERSAGAAIEAVKLPLKHEMMVAILPCDADGCPDELQKLVPRTERVFERSSHDSLEAGQVVVTDEVQQVFLGSHIVVGRAL